MTLDLSKIVDIEVDGVDTRDYPDFCDAYISKAYYPVVSNPRNGHPEDWRELTQEELDWLQENQSNWFYKKLYNGAFDTLVDRAEYLRDCAMDR